MCQATVKLYRVTPHNKPSSTLPTLWPLEVEAVDESEAKRQAILKLGIPLLWSTRYDWDIARLASNGHGQRKG